MGSQWSGLRSPAVELHCLTILEVASPRSSSIRYSCATAGSTQWTFFLKTYQCLQTLALRLPEPGPESSTSLPLSLHVSTLMPNLNINEACGFRPYVTQSAVWRISWVAASGVSLDPSWRCKSALLLTCLFWASHFSMTCPWEVW